MNIKNTNDNSSLIVNNIKVLNSKSKEISYITNPEYIHNKTNGLSKLKNKVIEACK